MVWTHDSYRMTPNYLPGEGLGEEIHALLSHGHANELDRLRHHHTSTANGYDEFMQVCVSITWR